MIDLGSLFCNFVRFIDALGVVHPFLTESCKQILNFTADKQGSNKNVPRTAKLKGDQTKSGGIATNIGVHFYDMLSWVFGELKQNIVHVNSHDRASGYLEFNKARVRWFLSINYDVLPQEIKEKDQRTYRNISIEGEELEFSGGFTDLHTRVYEDILAGKGYGLEDARQSIEIVHDIRNSVPIGLKGDYHPLAAKKMSKHPFEH